MTVTTSDYSASFEVGLYLSTLLVTIVFAWLLVFAIVIMPGIAKLDDDGGYLRAFQVIDGVIQKNQPIFVTIWISSVIALVTFNVLVFTQLGDADDDDDKLTKLLVTISNIAYLITQVTTFTKNVPLNNRVQTLDIAKLDNFTKKSERDKFEKSWIFWNNLRTIIMGIVSLYLMYLTLRL